MNNKKETISKKECAEYLEVSVRTVERLVKAKELTYANANEPHKHRKFYKEDIQQFKYRKDKKQRKTLELISNLFANMDSNYHDPNIKLLSLNTLFNRKKSTGAHIILEVRTYPVAAETNRYIRSFLLRDYPSNPDAHAAAVLSLIRSIEQQGGKYDELDCSCSEATLPNSSPNFTLEENEYQIKNGILNYASGWFSDRNNFRKETKDHILRFLRGEEGCTTTGSYIILDQFCILHKTGYNYVNGTTVYVYLAVALPDEKNS